MLSPPLLKIQKFNLYFNYMHAFSVLQYFQFLFIQLYTVFLPISIRLT
ncbi:NADH dehydrogenase [Bacillus mycoides]|nr:NADH dehydrogenase [Bacillus mycoides]